MLIAPFQVSHRPFPASSARSVPCRTPQRSTPICRVRWGDRPAAEQEQLISEALTSGEHQFIATLPKVRSLWKPALVLQPPRAVFPGLPPCGPRAVESNQQFISTGTQARSRVQAVLASELAKLSIFTSARALKEDLVSQLTTALAAAAASEAVAPTASAQYLTGPGLDLITGEPTAPSTQGRQAARRTARGTASPKPAVGSDSARAQDAGEPDAARQQKAGTRRPPVARKSRAQPPAEPPADAAAPAAGEVTRGGPASSSKGKLQNRMRLDFGAPTGEAAAGAAAPTGAAPSAASGSGLDARPGLSAPADAAVAAPVSAPKAGPIARAASSGSGDLQRMRLDFTALASAALPPAPAAASVAQGALAGSGDGLKRTLRLDFGAQRGAAAPGPALAAAQPDAAQPGAAAPGVEAAAEDWEVRNPLDDVRLLCISETVRAFGTLMCRVGRDVNVASAGQACRAAMQSDRLRVHISTGDSPGAFNRQRVKGSPAV